jgi:adenylate cyclase
VHVIEDDERVRASIERTLRAAGARPIGFASGVEGLAATQHDPPHALILDLGLPDLHGLAVCRALRAHPATARLPVLVLTGESDTRVQLDALRAGADDFVQKPSHPDILLARLTNQVARHRAEAENARLLRELERYVSTAARDQALRPRALEHLRCAILFSDLRDSTAASFAGDPERYAEAVRLVLGRQADIVKHCGGYVDKFTGDGMLAVFPDDQGPWQACRAAEQIVRWARRARESPIWATPPIGIGVHEGPVLRGDVGSDGRRDFTVMGPTVNVAARLCGAAGAGEVLVSDGVARAAGAFAFGPEAELSLKGLPAPLRTRRLVCEG